MRVLVLGGTVFFGRHVTDALLSRGHQVTLFNRGQQNPQLFSSVEKLCGNRDSDLSTFSFRSWDAVVDTCGYFPQQVTASTTKLRSSVPLYVFVSSVNQYADISVPGIEESHPSDKMELMVDQPLTPETYGPLKAACEDVVRQAYPKSALILRPGCLIGPYDQAHRFTYWVRRMATGGEMLVPGRPEQPWQVIDVRDVADWLVSMLEANCTGTYNVVGAEQPYTAHQLFGELAAATGSDTRPIWVDTEFLRRSSRGERWLDLAHWADLPRKHLHLYMIDNTRAVKDGLRFRPLSETARDVLTWLADRPLSDADALDLDHERNIVQTWKEKQERETPIVNYYQLNEQE